MFVWGCDMCASTMNPNEYLYTCVRVQIAGSLYEVYPNLLVYGCVRCGYRE